MYTLIAPFLLTKWYFFLVTHMNIMYLNDQPFSLFQQYMYHTLNQGSRIVRGGKGGGGGQSGVKLPTDGSQIDKAHNLFERAHLYNIIKCYVYN